MATYQDLITLIRNGDPVDSGTINRVLRQLDGNIKYLKQLIDTTELGSAVFARSVTVASNTFVGAPVYFNSVSNRFELALAASTMSAEGDLITNESAQVWGVVHTKHNSTSADILLTGYAELDISLATGGTVEPGIYFLSAGSPGLLTQQSPAVTVPVLSADDDGHVFINPRLYDAFMDHRHYKFELVCLPAGDHTPPALDLRHEITNPDTAVEGWLPADHAIFAGKAPYGAAFGYNLSASALNNLWPPIPLSNVYLEWNKGELKDYLGMGVPLGPDGLAVIDENGIWWMSDCYGDVPWPVDYDSSAVSSIVSSYSLECPRNLQMQLTLWFARMTFMTAGNVVTSLQVAEGSENFLDITCVSTGLPGSTGALQIAFDSDNVVASDTTTAGHIVFKELVNNQFRRGPVVEAITSSSSNVYLTSTDTADDEHRGTVNIAVITSALGGELPVQLVRLDGVTEENYEDVLGLGMPAGRDSAYRARFEIPATLDGITSVTMQIRLRLLAISAGSLPDLDVSYRRIPRPSPASTHTALPLTDTALTLDMSAAQAPTAMGAAEYIEVATSTFTAYPGDVVLFSVTRNGYGGDGYSGDMHVIDQRPVITAAV
jgi:hypothetical protein